MAGTSDQQPLIAVLGVGLIGGSIGLAARHRLGSEVVGFEPDGRNAERAIELGALDRVAGSIEEAVAAAEVIFCAAPVAAMPDLVAAALGSSPADAVVTDVGSTKQALVAALAGGPGADRFIGGHPLAGAETAGVEGARQDLFEGARWYLTPTERSQGVLFDRLHGVLSGIGARPMAIDAGDHDREMAAISHLPHVLANALASAAALLGPGGDVRIERVGINPTRIGLLGILNRMGADIEVVEAGSEGGEPVGALRCRHGALAATSVLAAEVPAAIDELTLIGLLGCFAEGTTRVGGAAELRHKESDRIAAVVDALNALGGEAEALPDGFAVTGTNGLRGGEIDSRGDHRLAMLGAVAGLASRDGVTVCDFGAARISYPGFEGDLRSLLAP